jgi:hypothetical protein
MAKKRVKPQNTGTIQQHTFDKDLVEDISGIHLKPNSWTQARNATPNTTRGDLGELSNEQSNKFCAAAPYTIIGVIHIDEDQWAIFSTDETDSEIGLFKETLCEYTTLVNDQCLNFSKLYLVNGQAKENFDCTFQLYWDDANNPTRTLNIDDIPWIEICTDETGTQVPNPTNPAYVSIGCLDCVATTDLDCDAIRLAPLVTNPCFRVEKGPQGGELLNGSYFVVGAYTVNEQRVTDYSVPSNVQSLFAHIGQAGSLEIIVEDMDPDFDEFELVVVEIRALKTLAKKIGIYSTRQQRISIDVIDERYPTVALNLIPLRNPITDKSDAIFRNGDYMIRTGPTDKFDFNYQPLANQIRTQWVSVEYDSDYYYKGGNNTNYLRDEVYPFFVRWVWDTGDKTPSFHIPGIYRDPQDLNYFGGAGQDVLPDETFPNGLNRIWRVENTAEVNLTSILNPYTLPDGGRVIASGNMAYWESTEKYDDDTPQIWDATYIDPTTNVNVGSTTNTNFDLCGKQIRHHRFPDNTIGPAPTLVCNHYNQGGTKIRLMAVQFDNIKPPVDNLGVPIPNIVGYEIMRGTREGNKTIIAKGMINNMRKYKIIGNVTPRIGLYPNYPFNPVQGPGQIDKFLSLTESTAPGSAAAGNDLVSPSHFTFHSPDTQFKDPFLSTGEMHIYGEMIGGANLRFEYPDGHPKNKLITDTTFYMATVAGVGYALIQKNGNRTTTKREPQKNWSNLKGSGVTLPGISAISQPAFLSISGLNTDTSYTTVDNFVSLDGTAADFGIGLSKQGGSFIGEALAGTGSSLWYSSINSKHGTMEATGIGLRGGYFGAINEEGTIGGTDRMVPTALSYLSLGLAFMVSIAEGGSVFIKLVRALSGANQYALQSQAHCFYDKFGLDQPGSKRFSLNEAIYLDPDIQDLGISFRINNLYRSRSVALETERVVNYPIGIDDTQQTVSTSGVPADDPTKTAFRRQAVSHYAALKSRLRNQYGQIEGIIQIPATTCMTPITQTTSDVIFGGDTYVNRYTEKNTMFFFYNWLRGQPDGAELDYRDYGMLPYPTYWANLEEYDYNEFFGNLLSNIANPSAWSSGLPGGRHQLDPQGGGNGTWVSRDHYFHLFNSGIRDFFVESEVNTALRDWGDEDSERHYTPFGGYTELSDIFNSGIIKAGNYFKYDYSLSVSRLYNSVTNWGHTHRRDYDPQIAEDCFVYRPNRVIYSLRQNLEKKKDFWKIFLPNNYKDFKSRVTAIKPVNKNGALILFENESPITFQGTDTLKTDLNTKLTIGDGGLFSQPLQNLLNTDDSYEYGSCQNRLSVVNTASGIFWMSQNQGKIFQIAKGVKEISAFDNKWWLSTYLPYLLTKDFPTFDLTDNPVAGIGCQAIYDNEAQIVYFCKRDFFLRDDLPASTTVEYVSGDDFLVNRALPIKLGDPDYFHDASWTISYDPKTEGWIGYHDWHPGLTMPAKSNFLTILDDGIWRHNDRCDSYCNFYGVDYPFEVEYATVTPQVVNTLRSVEYYMEAYKYDDNCYDRFHVLDFNFDEAVIYNSEQCSGLLRLNLSPKNNAPEIVTYPQINPTFIDVLYSKVEQKYRFNQFWDITANRGEFNAIAERMIFNTEANGYIRNLNPNNLDYNKFQTQRKKFRHYKNTVLLRRRVSGNRNMLVSLANNKDLKSPR